ncbi:hypothetical protein R3W88_014589 [Solanum pinnatisectum]|uniref:Peptidase M10 metallopeptidase domain-containing protein n=1 Tax=Solanum pinnatisectum TaxID=50273 RepID=A0AAV9KSP6_9SOLN|nr:hypothetical protein R3W88_014589 [Solanum pinnatisectum]
MRIFLFSLTNIVALIIVASSALALLIFTVMFLKIPHYLIPYSSTSNYFNKYLGCCIGQKIKGLAKAKQYFQHFGYIDNSLSNNFTDEFDQLLFLALNTYQLNFNLNITGEFNILTSTYVNGNTHMNSDKSPTNDTVAHLLFFEGQPRWPLSKNSVKLAFRRAFDKCSKVMPLTFKETDSYSLAHIRGSIFFPRHGDGNPFDGPMKIYARAFAPPIEFIHLDNEENWVVNSEDYIEGVQILYGSNPNYNGLSTIYTHRQENDISGYST